MAYRNKTRLYRTYVFFKLAHTNLSVTFKFHELNRQTLILSGIGENSDTYFQEQDLHVQGRGGFRLKPHIEVRFKWMWFPIEIFQSPDFSFRKGSKKKFDPASSRGLP